MEKFSEWLTSKFEHPLSPMFFFLGVVLVLLGVSNGFSLPVLNQLASDPNFRWSCLGLGVVAFGVAIFINYRPPKSTSSKQKVGEVIGSIPDELKMSYAGRQRILSNPQQMILTFITKKGFRGEFISQDVIAEEFSGYASRELFYRLEYLRLLGFLKKQKVNGQTQGKETFLYGLSLEFVKELGDGTVFSVYADLVNYYPMVKSNKGIENDQEAESNK